MFSPLPFAMPKLEVAVTLLDDPGLRPPSPSDMLDIGERLRGVYARARARGYVDLRRSELRKLPFAYWVSPGPVLTRIDPDLVRQYWAVHLPQALRTSPRLAKRWLAPLFFTYCEKFLQRSTEFQTFATRLAGAIQSAEGLFAERLRQLQSSFRFFSPLEAPGRLANLLFLDRSKSFDGLIQELQLWPGFLPSDFGLAVFRAGLSLPAEKLRDDQTVQRLMDWAKCDGVHVAKTESRVPFADALLSPWAGWKPADSLKNILIDFFIRPDGYGDPRFPAHLHYQWDGVSSEAKGVILNWLTGDTLRGFIELLRRTADEIWQHRQKFWMAYYERGYIDEAWMALGDDAWRAAKSLKMDEKRTGCARLEGGASNNQSVLLLKIGGLVFTEWSHNGSLRAYREGGSQAPRLYQQTYHGADLRIATSMDFHEGLNMRPELTHAHSDKGSWQRKARDFIRHHTSAYVSDREIL